jgi:hypothetical protein
MITSLQKGTYKLFETKEQVKILTLDGNMYAWNIAKNIGELFVTSSDLIKTDKLLATGRYRLHQIQDDPELSELQHLKLNVGERLWQGYILLTGLPSEENESGRIIPTRTMVSAQGL